jgi:tetratricopeptide (TPR) repeat protein
VSDDRLRALWDFLDLQVTERNQRDALAREGTDGGRAEVLTQIARVRSLQGDHHAAHALVDEAAILAGDSEIAQARVLLERGRILRLTGEPAAALPLFEQTYEIALAHDQHFVAVDAAHMCALAGNTPAWTERGLELAERYPSASHWRATLLLNLGRWHWDRGRHGKALEVFRASLSANSRMPIVRECARFGVGRALRTLGRPQEGLPFLEQAAAWAADADWRHPERRQFLIELAAAYTDVGRDADAAAANAAAADRSSASY